MARKGLAFLKGAVETACNVPAARKTWAACGRAAAASVLKGIRSRLVATETEQVKIVVHRTVDLSQRASGVGNAGVIKKKRPSGRSNWPKTKGDRDAWMTRRAARAARGEPVGRAALVAARRQAEAQAAARATLPRTGLASEDVAAYVPASPEEHAAFCALLSSVAHAAGVEEGQVVAPTCQVSMSADPRADSQAWSRRLRSGGRARAHAFVAVQAQTPARRVRVRSALEETSVAVGGTPPAPLSAGEALYVPVVSGSSAGVWTSPGEGDFVLELAVSIV
jgi:hypothetical protein